MNSPCDCPNPELCLALKRHVNGRLFEIWTGHFTKRALPPELCEAYRQAWCDAAGVNIESVRHLNAPAAPRVCVHLGEHLELIECGTCRGNVKMKVFACALHGECSPKAFKPKDPQRAVPHACWGCEEYEPL